MNAQTVDLSPLSIRAAVSSVNKDARTVELTLSAGASVDRIDWYSGKRYREVLSMKKSAIRLERMNAGASLLDSHSAYSIGSVLGAIEPGSVRIADGLMIGTVRFSRRSDVEDIWQDVLDGIVRWVSVGYRVHKFEEDASSADKIPTRTAIDWEPFEASLVAMPADIGARVRSGDKTHTNECVIVTRNDDADAISRFRRLALQNRAS